jgi:hypothetical protein
MSTITPYTVHTAVVAALVAAGLSKSTSHLGVHVEGSRRLNRCFAVIPISTPGLTSPGRKQANAIGTRFEERFRIEVGHILAPKDGHDVYQEPLQDLHVAIVAITGGIVQDFSTSSVRRDLLAQGQYLTTSFDLTVRFNLNLLTATP